MVNSKKRTDKINKLQREYDLLGEEASAFWRTKNQKEYTYKKLRKVGSTLKTEYGLETWELGDLNYARKRKR